MTLTRRFGPLVVLVALLLKSRSAGAQSHIVYHGGPIITAATIYPVYYGSAWTSTAINNQQSYLTNLTNYISGVGAPANKSPYLRQYGVTSASVASAVSVAGATTTLSDTAIRNIIHNAQNAHTLPAYAANILIMVFPATGFNPDGTTASVAYHRSESTTAFYGVTFADTHSSWPFNQISSHEIFEAVTDPAWFSGSDAWNNTAATEICDDSACQPTNQTARVFTSNGIQMLGCADNTQNGTCSATGFITNPGAPSSCGVITGGQGLISNSPQNAAQSCNLTTLLAMFSGSVGLYVNNLVWHSPTSLPAVTAILQTDGNFVVNRGFPGDSSQDTIWATNTFGQPGAYLAIQDDGNLVVYKSNGIPIWAYNSPAPPTACGNLSSGQGLSQGTSLSSCDGQSVLTMQLDGNLVLKKGGITLWASNTPGWGNLVMAVMQSDGNFVVYNRATSPMTALTATGTSGTNHVDLRNDGCLFVRNASNAWVWRSTPSCN